MRVRSLCVVVLVAGCATYNPGPDGVYYRPPAYPAEPLADSVEVLAVVPDSFDRTVLRADSLTVRALYYYPCADDYAPLPVSLGWSRDAPRVLTVGATTIPLPRSRPADAAPRSRSALTDTLFVASDMGGPVPVPIAGAREVILIFRDVPFPGLCSIT